MKYKFRKIDYSFGTIKKEKVIYDFGIEAEEDRLIPLEQIESSSWTPKEIQLIIDNCENLVNESEYVYQVEYSDLLIIINNEEVQFFIANSTIKEANLVLTYNEFITFMKAFKKFVAEAK